MATVREYFDTDAKSLTVQADWAFRSNDSQQQICAKIVFDFEANARYWHFFLPKMHEVRECIATLISIPQTAQCALGADGDAVRVEVARADFPDRQRSETLVFTRRLVVYVDAELPAELKRSLVQFGAEHQFHLIVRDRDYARRRGAQEKPLAFIAHDVRDKDGLVRELALELHKQVCPVWYDEYSLDAGDGLRTSIDKGFAEAPRCVLIVSPNFLRHGGWGAAEFDSVFTAEIMDRKHVVQPVWHGVGLREVYEFSPRLADRGGLPSSAGVAELSERLSSVLRAGT